MPRVVILSGGTGPERNVSISSGNALYESLRRSLDARLIELTQDRLPEEIDANQDVVFPVIHGTFGEDGGLQTLLEEAGFEYAGSQSASSRLCMNKRLAKEMVSTDGVRVCPSIDFSDPKDCNPEEIISHLGREIVLKPIDQGSSVYLRMICGLRDLKDALSGLAPGGWMLEKRVIGREVTIGMLDNHAMGVVEVIPVGGVYDYERKYQPGSTEYRFPAVIDDELEREIKAFARSAYDACKCRDFSRIDFMICEDGHAHFLEINTLPGLTQTSLLPKSASCSGYDFDKLCRRLIDPAIERFHYKNQTYNCHAA